MAEFDRPSVAARPGTAAAIDQGLRSYMLQVYNYMGIGLVVTGLVAYFAYTAVVRRADRPHRRPDRASAPRSTAARCSWVIMLAPLAFVLVLSFGINKLSVADHAARCSGPSPP